MTATASATIEAIRTATPCNSVCDVHSGHSTLFADFDADDCERRLALMGDLGLNCLRQAIGVNEVFDAQSGLKKDGLQNWDTFISLAEKHGIYLMPVGGYLGGNDWFDVARLSDNGKALDESCAFWAAFCGHYQNHPAIWAWDLRNELLYDVQQHMTVENAPDENSVEARLLEDWPRYLETRYGALKNLNRAYRSKYSSFRDVPGSVRFEENPFDLRLFDFRNYLNERGYNWCKAQCDVIREAARSSTGTSTSA